MRPRFKRQVRHIFSANSFQQISAKNCEVRLGRSSSSDHITKLIWACITARYDGSNEGSLCTDQVPPKPGKRKKLVTARVAHQKHDYCTLENQPERLINEAISLISVDDSSVKLTRNGEPNDLFLHLARDGHCQKSLNGRLIFSACLSITQWHVSMATVVKMMSWSSLNNWFLGLLSIKCHVSLAVERNSLLTQDRLASRKNFLAIADLNELSGIRNSIEDDSERSVSALQFPRMLLCPVTQTCETLKCLERRLS